MSTLKIQISSTRLRTQPLEGTDSFDPLVRTSSATNDEQIEGVTNAQLMDQLQAFRTEVSTGTRLLLVRPEHLEIQEALNIAIENDQPIGLRRENDIPLHSLLAFVALLLVVIGVVSVSMWLNDSVILLNPAVGMLCVVVSPFVYLMGRAARLSK
ncbi:hypothetical protein [Roseateles sp. P5_E7]